MIKYAMGAALAGVIVLAGLLYFETAKRAKVEAELQAAQLLLGACEARRDNITKDKESDNAVDAIPDADLGVVPDRWMRPEPGTGGIY